MIITPISGESTETQVITAGRRGNNRTIGDRLRITAEVSMTANFGAPVLVSGSISKIFWRGATSGGAAPGPIGLEIDVRRGASSVSTTTIDCPSSSTGSSVTISPAISVLEDDTIVMLVAAPSTGTATTVSNPYVAAKVIA